jgi:RNA 2',3'-cyclic 3'-phosphodiesterase
MPDAGQGAAVPTARVFFALWPDAEVRQSLMQVALKIHRQVDGKLTRDESLHMTLLFLGDIPVERLGTLADLAATVAFEPFTLLIDKAGCWKHNRIAWVAPSTVPPKLERLVKGLERRAAAEAFAFDARPFAPHVTLVRKARCAVLDVEPLRIQWDVRELVLVRSELDSNGSRYRPIGRWPPVSQPGPTV